MFSTLRNYRVLTYLTIGTVLLALAYHQYNTTSALRLACITAQKAFNALQNPHRNIFASAPSFVRGKLISLKKLSRSDFPEYYELLKDTRCSDLFFRDTDGTTPTLDPWYYLHYQLMSQFLGERIVYSVIVNATETIGGMIELISDTAATRGHISGLAHPNYWGQRMGLETVCLARDIFFEATQRETLISHVAPSNHRAQTFNLKCGFEFSHVSQEPCSKNDLVFIMHRPQRMAAHEK